MNNGRNEHNEFEDLMSSATPSNNQEDVNVYTGEGHNEGQVSLSSFLTEEKEETKNSFKNFIPFFNKKDKKPKTDIKSLNKKEKNQYILKRIGRIALTVLLIGVITCGIGVGTVVAWLSSEDAKGTFDMTGYDLESSLNFATTIYVKDKSGNYVEYDRLHGEFNRIWVSGDQVPDMLENAFIAIEDKRFRDHTGVDWTRTAFAFINSFINIRSQQGGSTITQQLVKNITMDNDVSAMRKVREIMRARYLENNYSKDSILEWYLNTIPMGTGIYGVEVAANYYFGKTCNDLTIAECASLASITQSPENHRPDLEANYDSHMSRRNTVLKYMHDQKYITDEEYEEAKETELKVVANKKVLAAEENDNSDFVDALIEDVVQMLVKEKGYDEDAAEAEIYNGGYKIYSTLNPDVQKALEKTYKNKSYFSAPVSATNGKTTPQSCMTIMDYEGHIVGIVGGKGKREGSRLLNRATSSPRQIGSSMKPIGVYSVAMEYNEITYSSMVSDKQMSWSDPSIKGGWPNNYDFSYRGKNSVEYAIYHSVNTTPVYILRNLIGNGEDHYYNHNNGIEISYDFLTTKLGLKHLTETDKNFASLCLGGCEYGATSEEMAAAYAVFGNLGYYYEPTTYTVIYDQFNNVIDDTTKNKPIVALSEDTATVMNKLLQTVVNKGTGYGAKISGFDTFAKTGTTTDSQDLWFVGGTPYYVASCWYGFDNPQKYSPNGMSGYFSDGTSVSGAALRIWRTVMSEIHEDLPEKEFADSNYAEKLKYCTSTGLIASKGCKSAVGWYRADNIPETCTKCKAKDKNKDNTKKENNKDNKKDEDVSSVGTGTTDVSSSASSTTSSVSSDAVSSSDLTNEVTSSVTSSTTQ